MNNRDDVLEEMFSYPQELESAKKQIQHLQLKCNQALKENEIMKKQLDGLHGQIMNLPCPKPAILLSEEQHLLVKTGHKYARHQAAELVAGISAGKE